MISPNLARDPRFRHRFKDESRLAARLRHPNLVRIHDAGEEDGLLFVTMDLIDGIDLRVLLNRADVLEPEHAARIVGGVADALDVAHAAGLVHRDVKPGNVLIEGAGAAERVYLTDFGLARHVEATSGVTATGAFVGTLDYVAPEQIRGDRVDARADVYALGCVLFELLTGNPPFAARDDKIAKMYAHLQDEAPRLRVLTPSCPAGSTSSPRARSRRTRPSGSPRPGIRPGRRGGGRGRDDDRERGKRRGRAARRRLQEAGAPWRRGPGVEEESGADAATRPAARPGADGAVAGAEAAGPPSGASGRGRLALAVAGLAAVIVAAVLLLGGGDDEQGGGGAGSQARRRRRLHLARRARRRSGGGRGDAGRDRPRQGDLDCRPLGDRHPRRPEQFVTIDDPIAVDGKPEGIAVDVQRGEVWVSGGFGGDTVTRFGIDDPSAQETFTVGDDPAEIAIGAGAAWVACGDGTVAKISVDDGSVETFDSGGEESYGIALGDGDVWITNRESDTVTRLDGSDGSLDEQFDAGENPKGIAFAGDRVWVASTDTDELLRFEADDSLKEATAIAVGDEPRGVVFAFGSIWVANGGSNSVSRVDATTGEELGTIEGIGGENGSPEGITVGPELVWVANGSGESVSGIDPDPTDQVP